jgi:CRP/FNR family transcriptional regulator
MACRQPIIHAPALVRTEFDSLLAYLRQHWLFTGADDAFVRSYGSQFSVRQYPAKAIVYDQGDPAASIYIVRSGKVRVGRLTPLGNAFTTAIAGRDQLLGEELLFEAGAAQVAQAMSLTASVCYIIPRATFVEMVSRHAAVAYNMARYVQAQRDDAITTVVSLASLQVPMRIKRLLHRLASEHGVADAGGTRIEVPLTHADIASLVGSTRETVSVELGRLLRAGFLARRDGLFTVCDRLVS